MRRIERESGANFLREARPPVVLGHKFQVHTRSFPVTRFVLDAQVRNGDLVPDDAKAVASGNLQARIRAEMGDVAVDLPRQLAIENDAEGAAAFLLNPCGFLLIKEI